MANKARNGCKVHLQVRNKKAELLVRPCSSTTKVRSHAEQKMKCGRVTGWTGRGAGVGGGVLFTKSR
jgi:hypothetical protein